MSRNLVPLIIVMAGMGCGKSGGKAPPDYHSATLKLVQTAPALNGHQFELAGFSTDVSGCDKTAAGSSIFTKATRHHVINLQAGDKNCVISLNSLNVICEGNALKLNPLDGFALQSGQTAPAVFVANDGSCPALVTAAPALASPFSASVDVVFSFSPFYTSRLWARESFFVPKGGVRPAVVPTEFLTAETQRAGMLDFVMTLECESALEMWQCNGQDLFSYRFRVLPKNSIAATEQAYRDALADEGKIIRVNSAQVYRNGVRVSASVPLEDGVAPQFLILSQIGTSVRTFLFEPSVVSLGLHE